MDCQLGREGTHCGSDLVQIDAGQVFRRNTARSVLEVEQIPNMFFLVGDEFGQVKLIRAQRKNDVSDECYRKEKSGTSKRLRRHTEDKDPDKSAKSSVVGVLRPPIGSLQRDFSVTSLGWGKVPELSKSDPIVDFSDENVVRTSLCRGSVLVGRKNGLVEHYPFPHCFQPTRGVQQLFRMPNQVVLCCGVGSLHTGVGEPQSLCLCISRTGECVVVDWDLWSVESPWETVTNLVFHNVPEISFKKKCQGRQERSDGAHAPTQFHEATWPHSWRDVQVVNCHEKDQDEWRWIHHGFKIPSPVHCAESSQKHPHRVVFGGERNLAKVVDLRSQAAYFSARNSPVNSVGLEDKVDVTAVTFLDGLSSGGSCLGVGNANGRLLLYDTRYTPKPVLDVQICDGLCSIVRIAAQPYLRYTPVASVIESDASMSSSEAEKRSAYNALQWSCEDLVDLSCQSDEDSFLEQRIAISDNQGAVYLYDLRAMRRQPLRQSENEEAELIRHNKKKQRQLYISSQYKSNTVISPTPSFVPIHYSSQQYGRLPWSKGGITDFSWSLQKGKDWLFGVSVGRFAGVWDVKNRTSQNIAPIYLKHQLMKCLSVDSIVDCSFDVKDNSKCFSADDDDDDESCDSYQASLSATDEDEEDEEDEEDFTI